MYIPVFDEAVPTPLVPQYSVHAPTRATGPIKETSPLKGPHSNYRQHIGRKFWVLEHNAPPNNERRLKVETLGRLAGGPNSPAITNYPGGRQSLSAEAPQLYRSV